ncbi:hypothetical protein AVEN_176583-1, partial [Araneus ventricosus]
MTSLSVAVVTFRIGSMACSPHQASSSASNTLLAPTMDKTPTRDSKEVRTPK